MNFSPIISVARLLSILVMLAPGFLSVPAQAADRGKVTGGMAHSYPEWFKESFLDLKEDALEAAEENKHTILFMSLNGCPYCARMLDETFVEDRALMEKDFDTIGINIRGDRAMVADGENEITEKQFARKMRVRFTPTVLFLDDQGETVFRINGFWDAAQFRTALSFVRSKSYKTMKISEYQSRRESEKIWDFRGHEQFSALTDLSKIDKPLLVLFEDAGCSACAELHDELLSLKEVKTRLGAYNFVRLDARSAAPIVDVSGNATTAADWAVKLGVSTAPTFIAFDDGEERQRVDSRLYSHHFVSILEFVSGKHYKDYDNWLRYNSARTDKVLEQGIDIDLSDGKSSVND